MARLAPIWPWANKRLQNQRSASLVKLRSGLMKDVKIVTTRMNTRSENGPLAKLKTPSLMPDEPV